MYKLYNWISLKQIALGIDRWAKHQMPWCWEHKATCKQYITCNLSFNMPWQVLRYTNEQLIKTLVLISENVHCTCTLSIGSLSKLDLKISFWISLWTSAPSPQKKTGDGGDCRNTETKYQHHKNFLKCQSVLISPVANGLSVMGKMNETTVYKLAKTVYYRVTF